MAQVACTKGYLHGIGKARVARALARKRFLENIQHRRAAYEVAGTLDRARKRILESLR